MKRFANKRVIVTGAGGGIGRASCLRIAEEGGTLVAMDIAEGALAETLAAVERLPSDSSPGRAIGVLCDLANPQSVREAVAQAVTHLGGLDVLCNIAGVLHTGRTEDYALDDWERVLRINLTGTFLMCQAAIPHLLETRGVIVNTSSTAALGAHPWMPAYAASKGGILSLTRALSIEYIKQGLRINVLCPGGIATPLHGSFKLPKGADPKLLARAMPHVDMADPKDAAAAIAFLASDDASFMHGAELRLDGGALT